jgi:hypothetical protein
VLVFAVYVEFVQLSNIIVSNDFVEKVSLSGESDSAGVVRFGMGDEVVLTAKVRSGNHYILHVFDEDWCLVFGESGGVNGDVVKARIPLSSPAFVARRNYTVVFEAGLLNLPVTGVNAFSPSSTSFEVVKGSSKMSVVSNFDEGTNELRLGSSLISRDLIAVENKTVDFYLKPNANLNSRDGGWVYLGSGESDVNGSAAFSAGLNMMGGRHEVEARFAGDEDFASSRNVTSFAVLAKIPYVRIVIAERQRDRVDLLLRVTDKYGFPLAGRMFDFEFLNLQKRALHLFSNASGYVAVSVDVDRLSSFVDSKITLSADAYTSGY